MPGFCFSNTDWVSGIIWPVISGLDTTATVTVPELLLVPLPPLLPEPLLEQAATPTRAATQLAAPRVRSLNKEELMSEPPLDGVTARSTERELARLSHDHTVIPPLG